MAERSGCETLRMPEPVTFVSHDMVHFGSYFTWVNFKYFAIQPGTPDLLLVASLISSQQYHDHYAGQDPTDQTHHSLHGPYRLEAISPEVFEPISRQAAREDLQAWVSSWVDHDEDGPEVEARLDAEVLPKVDGDSLLRLPNLREHAEHEWGWVVGGNGFLELVIINQDAAMLTLLVASDD